MADIDRIIERHYERDRLMTIVGGVGVLLGFVLLVLGVSGAITLIVEATKVSGRLVNASPGAVIAVVGFVLLGIQAWKRPSIKIRELPGGVDIELHESGPVFLLQGGLGVRLERPYDRDPKGDHWYGEPIDAMIERLTGSSLNREEPSPRTTIGDTDSVSLERTIGELVEAWSRSASIEGHGDRTVTINIGGEWKGYEFKGGQTYNGGLEKEQVGFVLHVLGMLAKRKDINSAA